MKKDELHIKILEYCNSKAEGFTLNELHSDLVLNEMQTRFLSDEISGSDLVGKTGKFRMEDNFDFNNQVLFLSFEGKFKLLEFQELQEARQNSTHAMILSFLAILISLISLYLTNEQLSLTRTQTIPEQIFQAQAKANALTFCRENSDSNQNFLFEVTTGKAVSCERVLNEVAE